MIIKPFFPLLIFLVFVANLCAQSVSGIVYNEDQNPIPFVNIWVPQLNTGTTCDATGQYFIVLDVAGEYDFVYSSIGYESKTMEIVFSEKSIELNVGLKTSNLEFEEIVVTASKRDPAYEIIRKVVETKQRFLKQADSYQTKVYIKAKENEEGKKDSRKKNRAEKKNVQAEDDPFDEFAEEERKRVAELMKLNLLEMEILLSYQYPSKFKEERTAYKLHGSRSGLFVPLFGEVNFNFYRNMVAMTGVGDNPIISPLSKLAVLTYKFKLEETTLEDDVSVYKIKVTPRKKGSSTCSGYLYINDKIWNINRLELAIDNGGLNIFDELTILQRYAKVRDSLWIVDRLEFDYETKVGKAKLFKGNTLIRFSDYEHNVTFPNKFFKNELAITTQEAYDRDTSYWRQARPESLTAQEEEMVNHRDSVKAIYSSEAYKDSIQADFNRITFTDLVYAGVGFRNHEKLKSIYIGSLIELIGFDIVGGFRLGPSLGYFKRWENGQFINTYSGLNIGLKNQDVQGNTSIFYRYDAKRLANIYLGGGRSFESINTNDAYLNQLKVSNYILHNHIELGHSIELINGLRVHSDFIFAERRSVENYNSSTFIDDIFDREPEPLTFDDYESFNTSLTLSYTPGQRYMTEPNRKIILGSKFPTFSLSHRKGWNGVLSGDTDFDFISFEVSQNISFGAIGQSNYSLLTGQYINTKNLPIVDLKRFRESDPLLLSDPLSSFQLLDTSFAATNLFVEFHHIHHFNGALINNIPFVKKTKVRAVAGGGFLWVKESTFTHAELFAGIERVFKISKRRRLRIGTYGVLARSSFTKTRSTFKISFDLIDSWKRDWSF